MLTRVFSGSVSLSLIPIGFVFAVCSESSLGGHPYVDRHFNLDSTPRYSSYGNGTNGIHAESGSHSSTCSSGTCSRTGNSAGGNCPPVQDAILRLWVPDDATVEINGHPTRPQTLGGIHRGSRVYSLEGLDTDRVSPCEIVVCFGDSMNQQRFYREIAVQAGGHYHIRFPDGFERISWIVPENSVPMDRNPTVPEYRNIVPSEFQTQIEHTQHSEQYEQPYASEAPGPQRQPELENVPAVLHAQGERTIMEP